MGRDEIALLVYDYVAWYSLYLVVCLELRLYIAVGEQVEHVLHAVFLNGLQPQLLILATVYRYCNEFDVVAVFVLLAKSHELRHVLYATATPCSLYVYYYNASTHL